MLIVRLRLYDVASSRQYAQRVEVPVEVKANVEPKFAVRQLAQMALAFLSSFVLIEWGRLRGP